MPLPRPMATPVPDPTPLRSPRRTGAPPTSASAFSSGARTRASPGPAASREEAGFSTRPRRCAPIGLQAARFEAVRAENQ